MGWVNTMTLPLRRSARLFIVDEIGRLLLFRYHDEHHSPFWATVGGELINDEDYLDAATRELMEETGLDLPIGQLLKERDEVYAVARSTPARWLEKYFLVNTPTNPQLCKAGWSEEEQSTIQSWQWWTLQEMQAQGVDSFKPEWLADLLQQVLDEHVINNKIRISQNQ